MTTGDVIGVVLRRWYVVLLGLALTAGAGLYVVDAKAGVYWGETEVVLLAPKSARYPNSVQQPASGAISIAGLVERSLNGAVQAPATASSGVTLAGQGIKQGSSIHLPDAGGQWAHNFSRPVLIVQAVGPTAEWVQAELQRQVSRIDRELATWQAGIRQSDVVTTSVVPERPEAYHLAGHADLALGMTVVLGGWFTLLACLVVELVVKRRRRPGAEQETAGQSGPAASVVSTGAVT